jgi:hypothetical protein
MASNELSRAEEVAEGLLASVRTSDDCPHLTQLIEQVNEGSLPKEEFVDIIATHLKENEKMERLKEVV